MRAFVASVATSLLVFGPVSATAQTPAPPTAEKAVQSAFLGFCIPAVLSEPAKAAEIATANGFKAASLPKVASFTHSDVPAWEVPASSGRVIVSRNASQPSPSSEAVPLDVQTCEIAVSGVDGGSLQKAVAEMATCKEGCPFTHNDAQSGVALGVRHDKYDWQPSPGVYISALTFVMPDETRGARFLVQVHALQRAP